jgi:hypothetical protein
MVLLAIQLSYISTLSIMNRYYGSIYVKFQLSQLDFVKDLKIKFNT